MPHITSEGSLIGRIPALDPKPVKIKPGTNNPQKKKLHLVIVEMRRKTKTKKLFLHFFYLFIFIKSCISVDFVAKRLDTTGLDQNIFNPIKV